MNSSDRISRFYNLNCSKEDQRLQENSLEFLMTYGAIRRALKPSSKILDMGGATGRYAIPLARDGHTVKLVDISEKELEIARRAALKFNLQIKFNFGDAKLYQDNEKYDTVLCLGPLYHCTSELEISSIIENMLNMLNHKGKLFLSFISKFAKFNKSLFTLREGNTCNFLQLKSFWTMRESPQRTFHFEYRDKLPITLTNPLLLPSYIEKHHWQALEIFTVDLYEKDMHECFSDEHYEWLHTLGSNYMLPMGEHVLVVIEKT
ncbi:MAG: class I SAM-dependent methyltransferase [Bacteroides sp.]|nr:class I SAM-dependent methyltransferase [Bacteroides sp.]